MIDIQKIITRGEKLFGSQERVNVEETWKELSEFILNNQHASFKDAHTGTMDSTLNSKGVRTTRRVFDSTAPAANQDLASSFQGTLTNPATVWSKLRFKDEELNNDSECTNWLEQSNGIMHNAFNESNFNTEIAKGYQFFTSLANMILFFEENDNGDFVFTAPHLGKIAWSENKEGLVDTIFRKFTLTARQAVEKFEKKLDLDIVKDALENPEKEYPFLHYIGPREDKSVKLNKLGVAPAKNRPIASVYIDMTHRELVEEGGYYEMPVYVPRWSLLPGELHGRGPGHLALPDIRTLNRLKQRGLQSIDLHVTPPVLANQRDVIGKLDLRPGGVSIVKDINGIKEFISQLRMDVLQFSIADLQTSIKSIFFLDKLLLPPRTETGEMTAYEVSQRIEQMQRVLGPVLSRMNNELLSPLIIRAFKILLRNGKLPEIPGRLRQLGINVEIVFVNQLARAQQIQDVSTIQQWIQDLAMLAQMKPEVLDMIDADGIAKHTAKIRGVPEIAIQNDKEVQAIRQARAKQQQQMQMSEMAVKGADVATKLKDIGQPQQMQ